MGNRIDVESVEPEYTADRTWRLTWFDENLGPDAPLHSVETSVSIDGSGYAEVTFVRGEPEGPARQSVIERSIELERERRSARPAIPVCPLCSLALQRPVEMGNPKRWDALGGSLFDCPECGTSLMRSDDPPEVQESVLIAAMHVAVMEGVAADDVADLQLQWRSVEKAYRMDRNAEAADRCRDNAAMLSFFSRMPDLRGREVRA